MLYNVHVSLYTQETLAGLSIYIYILSCCQRIMADIVSCLWYCSGIMAIAAILTFKKYLSAE